MALVAGLQFAMVASLYYISVTLNFPISIAFFLLVVQFAHWTQDVHEQHEQQDTVIFMADNQKCLYQQAG